MHQLSNTNTVPVSSHPKEGLLIPNSKSDTSQSQAPASVTGTQEAAAPTNGGTLGVAKTPLGAGFFSSGGAIQTGITAGLPASSSALGLTVLDSSKSSGVTTTTTSSLQNTAASSAPPKDPVLKELLAAPYPTSATTLKLSGATSNAPFGLMAGKPAAVQAGLGSNPSAKQPFGAMLSQGSTLVHVGYSLTSTTQPQSSGLNLSQGGLQSTMKSTGQLLNSTTSSMPFSQVMSGSGHTTTPSTAPPNTAVATSVASTTVASSGFQFGASVAKPPASTSAVSSGSMFGSTVQPAPTSTQSTFQFGGTTQPVTQISAPAPTGFQFSSTQAPAASTTATAGPQFGTVPAFNSSSTVAQPSTPFHFGGTTSANSKAGPPAFSFGGAASNLVGQTGISSTQASVGMFNTTTTAASSLFGAANLATATIPSFTPAFGQAVASAPVQPSATMSNFGNLAPGPAVSSSGGLQFKPAFGTPSQQTQVQQPSKAGYQFGSSPVVSASQPAAAASGGFTFNAKPAASSAPLFGTSAPVTAGASPFQTGVSSTETGMFGQQSSQPPSFGMAAQSTNPFGGTAPGQSVFGSQSSAPAPSSGGFNFGASVPAQTNPSAGFNFGKFSWGL